jgi:hypothetical protein
METTEIDYIQGGMGSIGGSRDLFDDPIDDADLLTAVLPDVDVGSSKTRYAPPPPSSPPLSPDIGAKSKRKGKGKAAARDKVKDKGKQKRQKGQKRKGDDDEYGGMQDDDSAKGSKTKRRKQDKNKNSDIDHLGFYDDMSQPKQTISNGYGGDKSTNKRKSRQKLNFGDSDGEATESDRDWDEWRNQQDTKGKSTKKGNGGGGARANNGPGLFGLMEKLRGSHTGESTQQTLPFNSVEQIDDSDGEQPRKFLRRTRL